jgi:hypothetical protein
VTAHSSFDAAQELRRGAVAGHHQRVELALHRLDALGVEIDDRDVVALAAERRGDVAADVPRPDDDDAHLD